MSRILSELEKSRAELLDLGLRNTLLNFRKLKTRGVEVVDELPGEVDAPAGVLARRRSRGAAAC